MVFRYVERKLSLVNGHPRDAKKVSETGADRLRECKHTAFVWELRKMGFVQVAVSRAVRLRECSSAELPPYHDHRDSNCLNE